MKKTIVLGLIVVILLPLGLDIILIQERFCDFIIGNEETWLTFWGGYLGSVIAVIVPFVILWKEIQFNKQEADKERKYQDVIRIKNDIAERISTVNFSLIIKSMLDTEIIPADEIQRLQNINENFIKLANMAKILYGYSRKEEERKFCEGYCNSLEKAIDVSNKIITTLSSMPPNKKLNEKDYTKFIDFLGCMKKDYDSVVNFFRDNVYPTAINYIQSIEKEYVELSK